MKTLYSSTFLTAVLGFLVLMEQGEKPIEIIRPEEKPLFSSIVERTDIEADGDLTIKIYTSFTCPTCKAFGLGTLKELEEKHSDEVQIYLTPNKEDENDMLATKAAHCSADQDKFADMLQKLYEMEAISFEEIKAKAKELELDAIDFEECLNDAKNLLKIDDDLEIKKKDKIEVIPSTLVTNKLFLGAHPIENIEREIRRNN